MQRWDHSGDRGFQVAEPLFHAPCDVHRYSDRELEVPPRKPEHWESYGRWGGSSHGCLKSAPHPPTPPPAELRGSALVGEVEPRQGVREPQAGSGFGRRALRLPALAAVLSRGLVARAQAPAPVRGIPWSSSLGSPARCCWPPEAPERLPQRGVSCQLPAESIGVSGARGQAGGDRIFLVSLPGVAPGEKHGRMGAEGLFGGA